MRRLLAPWLMLGSALVLLACVTINVYFPAAAAEEAADRIIRQVQDQPADDAQGALRNVARPVAFALLDLFIPRAEAQKPDIDISTPAVRALVGSMSSRFGALKPYYASGAIGLTQQATIAIRDLNAVPLPERGKLNKLVSDENADRNALYTEIAKANGHPEWADEIRSTFAARWIANAESGWHYQNSSGAWQAKR